MPSSIRERLRDTLPRAHVAGAFGAGATVLRALALRTPPLAALVAALLGYALFFSAVLGLGLAGFQVREDGSVPGLRRYVWGFVALLALATLGLALYRRGGP